MRTAMYNVDVASDRRRRENVPGHILCSGKMKPEQPGSDSRYERGLKIEMKALCININVGLF